MAMSKLQFYLRSVVSCYQFCPSPLPSELLRLVRSSSENMSWDVVLETAGGVAKRAPCVTVTQTHESGRPRGGDKDHESDRSDE